LAITEIAVALTLSFLVLGESLTMEQWLGVGILALSILLVRGRDLHSNALRPGSLVMRNIASQQFQWIAFHRAFGKTDQDREDDVMSQLTTTELQSIREMMGVDGKPMDPFPINPAGEYHVDLTALLPSDKKPDSKNPDS